MTGVFRFIVFALMSAAMVIGLGRLGLSQAVNSAKVDGSAGIALHQWADSVVEKTDFDFGDVKIGATVEPIVTLRNVTDKPFVIASVSSSCGCMTPSIANKTINPGESEPLKIKLDTKRFLGRRSASVHVSFQQPAGREIKLSTRVNIRNLICEPEEIRFLSGEEKVRERTLLVRRVGSPYWKIKSIESSYDQLTATVKSVEIKGNEVRYQVVCQLRTSVEDRGLSNETLSIKTNDSQQAVYEVPVIISNASKVKVAPSIVVFSTSELGATQTVIAQYDKESAPKFSIEAGGGFEIAGQEEINANTCKIRIKQTTATPSNSFLTIAVDQQTVQRIPILATPEVSPVGEERQK